MVFSVTVGVLRGQLEYLTKQIKNRPEKTQTPEFKSYIDRTTQTMANAIAQAPPSLMQEVNKLNKKWQNLCSNTLNAGVVKEKAEEGIVAEKASKKAAKLIVIIKEINAKMMDLAAGNANNSSVPEPQNQNEPRDEVREADEDREAIEVREAIEAVYQYELRSIRGRIQKSYPITLQYIKRVFTKLSNGDYGEKLKDEFDCMSGNVIGLQGLFKLLAFEKASVKDENDFATSLQDKLPEVFNRDCGMNELLKSLKSLKTESMEKILLGDELDEVEQECNLLLNRMNSKIVIDSTIFNQMVVLCRQGEIAPQESQSEIDFVLPEPQLTLQQLAQIAQNMEAFALTEEGRRRVFAQMMQHFVLTEEQKLQIAIRMVELNPNVLRTISNFQAVTHGRGTSQNEQHTNFWDRVRSLPLFRIFFLPSQQGVSANGTSQSQQAPFTASDVYNALPAALHGVPEEVDVPSTSYQRSGNCSDVHEID